jgi:hypothetical protein
MKETKVDKKSMQKNIQENLDVCRRVGQKSGPCTANFSDLLCFTRESKENDVRNDDHEPSAKLKELTETIGKTQMVLQTVEVSLDTQARKLQENPEVIKADLTTDPNTVGIEVKTIKKEALAQQHTLEDKMEANKRNFQARLGVVEARTGRRRKPTMGVSAFQPPTFNGNKSWSVFRRQFQIIAVGNK